MRFLPVTITLILLAGCSDKAKQEQEAVLEAAVEAADNAATGQSSKSTSILDLDEGPTTAPTITEQVRIANERNEGGLSARNRAAREASSQRASAAPAVPATVGAP